MNKRDSYNEIPMKGNIEVSHLRVYGTSIDGHLGIWNQDEINEKIEFLKGQGLADGHHKVIMMKYVGLDNYEYRPFHSMERDNITGVIGVLEALSKRFDEGYYVFTNDLADDSVEDLANILDPDDKVFEAYVIAVGDSDGFTSQRHVKNVSDVKDFISEMLDEEDYLSKLILITSSVNPDGDFRMLASVFIGFEELLEAADNLNWFSTQGPSDDGSEYVKWTYPNEVILNEAASQPKSGV